MQVYALEKLCMVERRLQSEHKRRRMDPPSVDVKRLEIKQILLDISL